MKINIENFIIRLLYILSAGIIMTQALNLASVSSLLFSGTFVMVVLLWLVVSMKRMTTVNILGISIVAFAVVNVLLNALFTETMMTFSYMKKVIIFSSTILFFTAASESKIDDGSKIFIGRVIDFITLFLIFMYYVQNSSMHIFYGQVTSYLTFRFTNPNLTAIFLTSMLFYKIISMINKRYRINKAIDFVLAAFLLKFIIETKSRNCLLVVVVFFVQLFVYYRMPRFKIFTKKIYAKFMAVWPFIFAILYMAVIRIPVISQIFSFLISEGKGINSRYRMWSFAFENVFESPILGAYSQITYGIGETHMHNSHIEVLASYGVVVMVLVCVFLYLILWNKIKSGDNRINVIYNIAFASVLLVGMGEAALFSGGLGVYLFAGMLLLLNNDNNCSSKRVNK